MFKTIFMIFFIQCAYSVETQIKRPVVRIKQGLLVGVKVYTESGKAVDTFLGIPFAMPPINQLRFAPPQPHTGWNGTYQASAYGPSCPQLPTRKDINEKEDCLYLNIWAPEGTLTHDVLLPVVIFLDGVDFAKGNRFPTSGQDLATEGVIVININYRLNVFGFLCFENKEARGNMGLLDQYLALIWIKENIRAFGGDSKKITFFGYSAGAASVTLHMISARTTGLFQKAVISSGSALSPWNFKNDVVGASQKVARLLGCLNGYAKSVLSCLRTKSTTDILKAYEEYSEFSNYTDLFSPIVDDFLPLNDQYLPVNYEVALKSGTINQIPILMGVGKPISDPLYLRWKEIADEGYVQFQNYIEQNKIPEVIYRYNLTDKSRLIFDLLKWRYITSSNGDVEILYKLLVQMYFEAKTEVPNFLQLNYLLSSHTSPIYVFYVGDLGFTLNSSDYTVSSELILLFGPLLLNQVGRRRFSSREQSLSKRMKAFVMNFTNYGNPSSSSEINRWPSYKANEKYIQYIGYDATNISTHLVERTRSFYFWNHILKIVPSESDLYMGRFSKSFSKNFRTEYKHAMYTLTGLVVVLLLLLLICIILLKKRSKEAQIRFQVDY